MIKFTEGFKSVWQGFWLAIGAYVGWKAAGIVIGWIGARISEIAK